MNQYDFQQTLHKYLSGQHTQEEEDFVLEYFKNNPMDESAVFENEKDIIGKRIQKKLFRTAFGKPLILKLIPLLAAAATILIAIGIGVFVKNDQAQMMANADLSAEKGLMEYRNTSDQPQKVTLEDGSIVTLKKNSSLSYPGHFGERNRQVYLHGEAFFQIKKNIAKPFIVHSGDLVTKVLGTSFNIKSYDKSASVEVRVKTGRVSVYEGTESQSSTKNGVILTPNQKIVFNKKSRKMEFSIVENPSLLIPVSETEYGFSFSEVPVKSVFASLEKSYGIDIVLENDTADSCLFTGDLNGLTLFEQLDLICKSANISYERRGTALFVQGAGCVND
ncbi:FecR family protein [Dyadobacter aurulentus]|uniref:FecR family protein n=1 Tax=Dyadobacter sp. UC 10 TaxID=2605428 RepID=UPI0011F35766|nr:FecR family protein [Dyadobacter sp. UC 10]KAA0991147.1 FecR family protein [Dyadobacter sp. UC 10]